MLRPVFLMLLIAHLFGCKPAETAPEEMIDQAITPEKAPPQQIFHTVGREVTIRNYFEYLDTLVAKYDRLLPHSITEHLLVRANPWLIDTLQSTDYYRLIDRGVFEYDPQSITVLHKDQKLLIPGEDLAKTIAQQIEATVIDINIPEYKLRILEGDRLLQSFPIRVGRNQTKYLEMAGRNVDLRTRTGKGKIVRIVRNPVFANPSNNKRYEVTRRDDQKVTKLPRIPWLEPELDGLRHGHLIHPTTNPRTLGKASSNGCIGMKEADMWQLYYHAPMGTSVTVRYDLNIINAAGDSIQLPDIYRQSEHRKEEKSIAVVAAFITASNCDCNCLAIE